MSSQKSADDRYGDAEPVTFRYPKVKPDNGKRSPKADISVSTCEPCRRERYVLSFCDSALRIQCSMSRLLDFEETQIYLKLERTSIPTSRRSKDKEVSYNVKKTTTVLDIKVEVSPPFLSRRHHMYAELISDHASNEYNAD